MKVKKLMALVVALTMVLSLIVLPNTTASAFLEYSESKADVSFVYMGKADSSGVWNSYPTGVKPMEELNVGDSFWVGVQFSNLSRIKSILEGTGETGGIMSLTFRMAYDQDYLTYAASGNANRLFNNNTYLQSVYEPYEYDGSPLYSVANAEYSRPGTDAQHAETLSINNPSDVKIIIRLDNSMEEAQSVPRLLQQNLNDDPIILAMFAFTVNQKPENGRKVLQAEFGGESFIIETGWDVGIGSSYAWSADGGADNARDYFNAVNNGIVNIFPSTYKVEFLGNGGDGDETVMHTVNGIPEDNPKLTNEQIQAADATITSPTEDGKYFAGWYTEKDGDSKVDINTDIAQLYTTQGGSDNTVKLYSKWEQGQAIQFHSNYPPESDKQSQETQVTLYADPTTHKIAESELSKLESMKEPPTGYAFAGWSKDSAKETADITDDDLADTALDGVTNVYAVWSEMITINFYDNYQHGENDGKGAKLKSLTMDPNSSIQISGQEAPSQPSRDQYTFKEWNTKQNGTGTPITQDNLNTHTFSESTDLFAIWTAAGYNQVTLTFDAVIDAADATVNPSSITVNQGDMVYKEQITDDPTVANYKFDGWYKSPAANTSDKADFDAGYQANATETLYAHWTHNGSNPVTVTFKTEGASGGNYAEVTVESGDSLGDMMPTNPSKEGSQFEEWNEGESGDGATFNKDTQVNGNKTVYAQWVDKITVAYDLNGEGASPDIPESSGLPGDPFTLTETEPERYPYDFIGWNTKKNGSGADIGADNGGAPWTYQSLADAAGDAFQDGKVTLYAVWGYVLPPHATPEVVKVTFDSNAVGGATDANPKEKYIEFDHSIGDDNMPNPPTREGYTFEEWNTKQNGTGDTVDGNYTFTQATDDPDNNGETTVYAQWTVTSPDDEITISFDTNGAGPASPTEMKIKKNDALSALPDTPTREGYKFLKWALGKTDSDTAVTVGSPTFSDSDTVYAVWEKTLRFDIGYNNPDGDWNGYNQTVYNGENQPPTYIKVYDITNVGEAEKLTDTSKDVTEQFKDHYTLEYQQDEGDANAAAPKDVGEYKVVVKLDNYDPDAKVSVTNPGSLSVVKQGVTVAVTEDTQEVKVSSSSTPATAPTITVTDAQSGPFSSYETKYYKWTPSGTSDSTIDAGEVASEATDAGALTVGWYVVKVTITDDNYEIGKVTGKLYDGAGGLPTYAGAAKGENIVFHVILNDPKATDLKVAKPDGSNLDLKDENYTSPKPFNSEEKTDTDYYVRADKDTNEVDITVEAEPDYDVKVEFNGHVVEKDPSDNKYHIEGLEGAKGGSSNDVKVTVTPHGATEPAQEYTVHVQRLVEAKIEFKPGNSPYGLIERMSQTNGGDWDADKVQAAKTAFDETGTVGGTVYGNHTYGAEYVPTHGQTTLRYSTEAWTDFSENYDKNTDVIFVYEADSFKDPGVIFYDETGTKVDPTSVKATLVDVKLLGNNKVPYYDEDEVVETKSIDSDATGKIDLSGNNIRPNKYDLKITCTYTDASGNAAATAEKVRPCIVLPKRGDIALSTIPLINTTDTSNLTQSINNIIENSLSLFKFRTADLSMASANGYTLLNTSDTSWLMNNINSIANAYQAAGAAIPQFYDSSILKDE